MVEYDDYLSDGDDSEIMDDHDAAEADFERLQIWLHEEMTAGQGTCLTAGEGDDSIRVELTRIEPVVDYNIDGPAHRREDSLWYDIRIVLRYSTGDLESEISYIGTNKLTDAIKDGLIQELILNVTDGLLWERSNGLRRELWSSKVKQLEVGSDRDK